MHVRAVPSLGTLLSYCMRIRIATADLARAGSAQGGLPVGHGASSQRACAAVAACPCIVRPRPTCEDNGWRLGLGDGGS